MGPATKLNEARYVQGKTLRNPTGESFIEWVYRWSGCGLRSLDGSPSAVVLIRAPESPRTAVVAVKSPALLASLSRPLQERVHALSSGTLEGLFVLVWMRAALRAHENPALDVALAAADRLGLPVFVYQGLSSRYPYASDRHHTFILESAREAHQALKARGIGSALHVEREGHQGPHLKTLAAQAAVVITEDLPVPPLRQWTRHLSGACATPVWAVDTACILPMRLAPRTERAFEFRKATAAQRAHRLESGWEEQDVSHEPFLPSLPFAAVDVDLMDIPQLVATCDIDHGVGPVPDTPGGTTAGRNRWRRFLEKGGLRGYARKRNDAHIDGVSRMSAYLHYGTVSPFELAREALQHGGDGAKKWLDEFLIWRELAYSWCAHTRDIESLSALPRWARETLVGGVSDRRAKLFSWEALAHGETGSPLWDLAQTSLLRHGELHNNLRMTWGKQLLQWTPSPEAARSMLVDLNHRYALDGRDPCSYGGLYWCLGLFDRPFTPPSPVLGTVRGRSVETHTSRLSIPRLRARILRPAFGSNLRVAVVGAGIAGLSCSRALVNHGIHVEVFEKTRGPSGRANTQSFPEDGLELDHGAPYFTARDPLFRRHVESWVEQGSAALWKVATQQLSGDGQQVGPARPAMRPRYVGFPRMSAVGRHLARGLTLHVRCSIAAVDETGEQRWHLVDESGRVHGPFDRVVVAVPAPQAATLVRTRPDLEALASSAQYVASETLMMRFDHALDVSWDAATVRGDSLAWVARESSKPGRADSNTWIAQSSSAFAAQHLASDRATVERELLAALSLLTGRDLEPRWVRTHRWSFARPGVVARSDGRRAILDRGLGLCGDWLIGPRVEAAWLSGRALAGRLLAQMPRSGEPTTAQLSLL